MMENHITSVNSVVSYQDSTWKRFEYRTIQYEDGSTIVRLRGYSDFVDLYGPDGKMNRDPETGKNIDYLA